jgi:hypothetical protein
VQHLENMRLSSDGNRFEGTWSGAEPHHLPLIGIRKGTTSDVQPSPAAPNNVAVEPRGIGRQSFPVRIARGGTVEVIVSDNPSNPMKHELVSTAPGLRKSGRDYQSVERQPDVIGGPRGKYHYKFIAERDGQIVFHMTRPWESRPTLVAVIEVTVVE